MLCYWNARSHCSHGKYSGGKKRLSVLLLLVVQVDGEACSAPFKLIVTPSLDSQ